jgi:hypothetical protein
MGVVAQLSHPAGLLPKVLLPSTKRNAAQGERVKKL